MKLKIMPSGKKISKFSELTASLSILELSTFIRRILIARDTLSGRTNGMSCLMTKITLLLIA
jgi:hypothetical protein